MAILVHQFTSNLTGFCLYNHDTPRLTVAKNGNDNENAKRDSAYNTAAHVPRRRYARAMHPYHRLGRFCRVSLYIFNEHCITLYSTIYSTKRHYTGTMT